MPFNRGSLDGNFENIVFAELIFQRTLSSFCGKYAEKIVITSEIVLSKDVFAHCERSAHFRCRLLWCLDSMKGNGKIFKYNFD